MRLPSRSSLFLAELKRRNVGWVAAVYAVGAAIAVAKLLEATPRGGISVGIGTGIWPWSLFGTTLPSRNP